MSTDPKLPDYVRTALDRLRAAHPADAAPSTPTVDVEGVLERVLRDLPGATVLPELPSLSDDDWDSPDSDFDPHDGSGGDGSGGDGSGGTSDGGGAAGGDVGSASDAGAASDGADLLSEGAGTGSLVSLLAAPISLGKALLTLALPAALLGGMVGTVAVESRRVEVDATNVASTASTPVSSEVALPVDSTEYIAPQTAEVGSPVDEAVGEPAPRGEAPSVAGPSGGALSEADLGATEEPTPQDTLPAERRLIDAARAAMTRRDVESCMRFVAQHRRRFAAGALAEERDAVDVRCQIMAGDPAAERAAEDFRRRYPSSFQLGVRNE